MSVARRSAATTRGVRQKRPTCRPVGWSARATGVGCGVPRADRGWPSQGLTAQRIWQDLCEQVAYPHSYASVRRYAQRLKRQHPKLVDVMEHPPGEEGQVDFFQGTATFDEARPHAPDRRAGLERRIPESVVGVTRAISLRLLSSS